MRIFCFSLVLLCAICQLPARADITPGYFYTNSIQNRYMPVEYVQGDGNAYIATGAVMDSNKVRREYKAEVFNNLQAVVSGADTTTGGGFTGNFWAGALWTGTVNIPASWRRTNTTEIVVIDIDDNEKRVMYDVSVDGVSHTLTRGYSGTIQSGREEYLFADNAGNGVTYKSNFRIYYYRLYKNNVLTRDFIPVYDTVDGAFGMYDTVSNNFFGNAGTGDFIGGPATVAMIPCTNAPTNAYYTGSGIINDCPWECDDGYGLTSDNTCEQLCTAGITKICNHFGCTNLYANRPGTPALCVKNNDTVCYGRLMSGRLIGRDAIHIKYKNTVYHLEN